MQNQICLQNSICSLSNATEHGLGFISGNDQYWLKGRLLYTTKEIKHSEKAVNQACITK